MRPDTEKLDLLDDAWRGCIAQTGNGIDVRRLPGVTTEAALATVNNFVAVPMDDGGLMFECHAGGADIEIEVAPDGAVVGVSWTRSG